MAGVPTRLAVGVPVGLAVARWRFSRLRRAGPTLIGLTAAQRVEPMMLSAEGWSGAALTDVTLSYGRVLDPGATLIELTTYLDGERSFSLGAEIARRERQDAAIANRDWERISGTARYGDESEAARMEIAVSDLQVFVNSEPQRAQCADYRHYRALGFSVGAATVRAVFRHPPSDGPLRFETLSDLEPYFLGHTRFLLGLLTWRPSAGSS